MDQLKTIFRALGTPTEEEWPVRSFPFHSFFPRRPQFFFSFSSFSRAFRNIFKLSSLRLFFNFLFQSFFDRPFLTLT